MFIDSFSLADDDRTREELGIDLVYSPVGKLKPSVVEAETVQELKEGIESKRMKSDLLIVFPKSFDVVRSAFSDHRVDIVMEPFLGRKDIGVDHVCMKSAHENNVFLGIRFSSFLFSHGRERAKFLRTLSRLVFLAQKYRAGMSMASGAETKWDMRRPREMMSLLINAGAEHQFAMDAVGLGLWKKIQENRERIEGKRFGQVVLEDG